MVGWPNYNDKSQHENVKSQNAVATQTHTHTSLDGSRHKTLTAFMSNCRIVARTFVLMNWMLV